MIYFDPNRTYSAERDVRPNLQLLERMRVSMPEGSLWVLVGTRRSGKTWALRGVLTELVRGGAAKEKAKWIDLRSFESAFFAGTPTHLLLDEPGSLLERDPRRLLERCAKLKGQGCRVVAAMTPREWALLRAAGGAQIHVRDRLVLTPLGADQSLKMAERAAWGPGLLKRLDPAWLRNPFVLELLLAEAERQADLRAPSNIHKLHEAVVERALDSQTEYFHFVFEDGLADEHRAVLRALCRGEAATKGDALDLLGDCGLVDETPRDAPAVGDPILARLLPPPMILHHVSDVHFGGKAAAVVDAKAKSGPSKPFAAAIGSVTAAESYLEHVKAAVLRGRGPHLLIISGDLAEIAAEQEFIDARAWVDRLDAACRSQQHVDLGNEPRVLLTGGNHDVDWQKAGVNDPAQARHEKFAAAFADYKHPHLEVAPDKRPLVLCSYARAELDVMLLGSSEFGGQDQPRMRELASQLWEQTAEAFRDDHLDEYASLRGELERIDPSLVHESTLKKIRNKPCRSAVRIAVLHHPLSAVPGVLAVARFSGLINAGAVKDALWTAGVQLVLHGHEHTGFLAIERWPGRYDGELHIASAPSLGSREVAEQRGYNEIRVMREGARRVDVSIQSFVQIGDAWEARGEPVIFRAKK